MAALPQHQATPLRSQPRSAVSRVQPLAQETDMIWTAPTLVEVNVGMEVTSYASAKR
jgi:coenzyme PQQ precursor peptide PqqA